MPVADWPDCYDEDYELTHAVTPSDPPKMIVIKPKWWQFEFREMRFADWYALLFVVPEAILLLSVALCHSHCWLLYYFAFIATSWLFYFLFETD